VHLHNEGMVHLQKDKFLQINAIKRIVIYNDVFPDAFHGKVSFLGGQVDHVNFSKVPSSYYAHQLKIF